MIYATREDLAIWLGYVVDPEVDPPDPDLSKLPAQADLRMLKRASLAVSKATMTAVYDVDADGLPEDDQVAEALRDATCAQVEAWLASGDELGQAESYDSVQIGSVRLTGKSAAILGGQSLAPRAADVLHLAGLLAGRIRV